MEKKTQLKNVNGILFPEVCPKEAILSALSYKARPGDLFIAGYPRCGNTWIKHIVMSILRKGQDYQDPLDFILGCPYLELYGADCVDYMLKRGAIATHLPFNAIPYSYDAKYIYINRNPRDCCVSRYHLRKTSAEERENRSLSFDEYFEDFIQGNISYGDYFDHVLEWYEHRNDGNIHFVMYENLKKNTRSEILKIAKFIGEEYEECILEDDKITESILRCNSFEYMKSFANREEDIIQLLKNRDLPSGLKTCFQSIYSDKSKLEPITDFFRKGIVGDWKNYFKQDQLKRLEAKIKEKTDGSDISMLWKDII